MKLIIVTLAFFTAMSTVTQSCNLKKSDTVLHYLLREPTIKSSNPPLIILLHGIGSNEHDLFSFADHLPGKFLVVSVQAPYSLGNNGYAWYHADYSTPKPVFNKEEAEKSRNTIIQFIRKTCY